MYLKPDGNPLEKDLQLLIVKTQQTSTNPVKCLVCTQHKHGVSVRI